MYSWRGETALVKIPVLSPRLRHLMVKNKVIHCQSSKSGDLMTSIPYQRQFISVPILSCYSVTLIYASGILLSV